MTYTKEQFLSDVKAEAVALRQHATKEERERLDIKKIDDKQPGILHIWNVYGSL